MRPWGEPAPSLGPVRAGEVPADYMCFGCHVSALKRGDRVATSLIGNLIGRRHFAAVGSISIVFPQRALASVFEDLGAQHVRHGGISKVAVVENGKIFANGGIPRLTPGNINGSARWDHVEHFPRRIDWHAYASVSAWIRFYEAPMQTISGFEFHPIRHRIAGAGATEATALFGLRVNGEIAKRGRIGSGTDRDRSSEKHGISLKYVESLGPRAEHQANRFGIFRLLSRRIEVKRGLSGYGGRFTTAERQKESGQGGREQKTIQKRFHVFKSGNKLDEVWFGCKICR